MGWRRLRRVVAQRAAQTSTSASSASGAACVKRATRTHTPLPRLSDPGTSIGANRDSLNSRANQAARIRSRQVGGGGSMGLLRVEGFCITDCLPSAVSERRSIGMVVTALAAPFALILRRSPRPNFPISQQRAPGLRTMCGVQRLVGRTGRGAGGLGRSLQQEHRGLDPVAGTRGCAT